MIAHCVGLVVNKIGEEYVVIPWDVDAVYLLPSRVVLGLQLIPLILALMLDRAKAQSSLLTAFIVCVMSWLLLG